MKNINLFGLLVAGACSLQACHSPESRSIKTGSTDSSSKDTSKNVMLDDAAAGARGSNKDSLPKDVTNESSVDGDEATFMNKAAVGGMMEVDLGKLAQKSTNPQVKDFAALMVKDHGKANAELKALALKSKILLPAGYPADDKAHLEMMAKMKGADFDKHYIDMMVTDHDKTIALFKMAASSTDKGVSDFAKKTIPVIEGHFEKAKAIQAGLK